MPTQQQPHPPKPRVIMDPHHRQPMPPRGQQQRPAGAAGIKDIRQTKEYKLAARR